jgi:hypothetical protein
MANRDFLQDIKIVGALMVSRCGTILHYSIPNLMKWCDSVVIMLDNENEETRFIVKEYEKVYNPKITVIESGFPSSTLEEENRPEGLFKRFRPLQPYLRDKIFKYIHNLENKPDIIVWPDSDEIFDCSFPEILTDFWNSDKKGLYAKHISVYDKLNVMIAKSQPPDVIAYKYDSRLSAIPYRQWQVYDPLTKQDLFCAPHTRIHLAHLTREKREWRKNTWRPDPFHSHDKRLWLLPKNIDEMTSEEINHIKRNVKPDMTIDEYNEKFLCQNH